MKLNVFEMKCLRSMTGVSQLDRVRNEVVKARTGVRRELAARVDMNVLRWFGHVERMDNERLLKKVMSAKVDVRSARGRPRFGCVRGALFLYAVVPIFISFWGAPDFQGTYHGFFISSFSFLFSKWILCCWCE